MSNNSTKKSERMKSTGPSNDSTTQERQDLWRRDPEAIKHFLNIRPDYQQLCAEVEYILRKCVSKLGIQTASILSRAKTLESFLEKIERKKYADPFTDLTDLAGARVVCLYSSDVNRVAEIIHSEFDVAEDVAKIDTLGADKFGYGARHFIVRLGKATAGARYDDLKEFACEIQVRTVVQDAWSIIQHHMVYKGESQVPTQLQRKLNSLSGLFETVDDQFESIRTQRDAYLLSVRESMSTTASFLENELNLDTLKEYLEWTFQNRSTESADGQLSIMLDTLKSRDYKTLKDVDQLIKNTKNDRERMAPSLPDRLSMGDDGEVPSSFEIAWALGLTLPDWEDLFIWGDLEEIIRNHRVDKATS